MFIYNAKYLTLLYKSFQSKELTYHKSYLFGQFRVLGSWNPQSGSGSHFPEPSGFCSLKVTLPVCHCVVEFPDSINRIKSNFQLKKYDLHWDDKPTQCTSFDLKTQLSLIALSKHIHQHISNRCDDIQFVEKQKLSFNRGKGQHKVLVVLASPSQN